MHEDPSFALTPAAPGASIEEGDPLEDGLFEPLKADSASGRSPTPAFAAPGTGGSEPEPAANIDPRILESLHRAERCRAIFQETYQESELWEVILLVLTERHGSREAVDELLKAKEAGKLAKFHEGARALYSHLLGIRAKYSGLLRSLREFMSFLPLRGFGKDTIEMSLGLMVSNPADRKRAEKWLEDPKKHAPEAAAKIQTLLSRTRSYLTALRRS